MTLLLPEPYVGGPLVDRFATDDPGKLEKQLRERFDQLQSNFDAVALQFPMGAENLSVLPQGFAYLGGAATHTAPGAWAVCPLDTSANLQGGLTFNATNKSLVVPANGAGRYLVTASCGFAPNATASRGVRSALIGVGSLVDTIGQTVTDGNGWSQSNSIVVPLAALAQVRLEGYQNSGGNLGFLGAGSQYCSLTLSRIA